jgi:hypothetical protein
MPLSYPAVLSQKSCENTDIAVLLLECYNGCICEKLLRYINFHDDKIFLECFMALTVDLLHFSAHLWEICVKY